MASAMTDRTAFSEQANRIDCGLVCRAVPLGPASRRTGEALHPL